MDKCLRVLKESNKSRFDSYSVRNSILIISHITFRDCRAHIFSDNLSQNSCILTIPIKQSALEFVISASATIGSFLFIESCRLEPFPSDTILLTIKILQISIVTISAATLLLKTGMS